MKLDKFVIWAGKIVAIPFYLAPVFWYGGGSFLVSHKVFVGTMGLWNLNTKSNVLLCFGRAWLLVVLISSFVVSVLIVTGKAHRFRKIVYFDLIFCTFYLFFLFGMFSHLGKWNLVGNFLTGRFCLIAAIGQENQNLKESQVSLTRSKDFP